MTTGWDLQGLATAAGATAGKIAGDAVRIDAISTDSRKLPAGALFVALRGEKYDGHTFAAQVAKAGARAVLVDSAGAAKLGKLPVPVLVVPDTLKALGDMAHWVRTEHGKPVAAITGSNGKTTTKELLAAVLGEKGLVHKTQGNLNNLIGVPLTLFEWKKKAWAGVIEMGMNAPGEIARLAEIAQPNVGLVTCVAEAHLGGKGLGSLEAIAKAKAELYAGLPKKGIAVINADDAALVHAAKAALGKRKAVTFGRGDACDVRLERCVPVKGGLELVMQVAGERLETKLPLIGQHNGMNAAGAVAAAWVLGMKVDVMAAGLAKVQVPGARLKVVSAPRHQLTIIDDSYNANPGSMAAAFAAQRDLAGKSRRLAALGDMLEMGDEAAAYHRKVGAMAAEAGIAMVWTLGPHAADMADGVRDAGGTAMDYPARDVETLCRDLAAQLKSGDVLLVKGSRGMKMERVVQWLRGETG